MFTVEVDVQNVVLHRDPPLRHRSPRALPPRRRHQNGLRNLGRDGRERVGFETCPSPVRNLTPEIIFSTIYQRSDLRSLSAKIDSLRLFDIPAWKGVMSYGWKMWW